MLFRSSVCPLFVPDEPMAMHGDRLVVGAAARLSPKTRQRLLTYLFAVAGDAPDRAWAALQAELVAAPDAAPAEQVGYEMRRLVPFRDARSTETGSAVADRAFLQWRTASRHGWLPAPQLAPFYRGLFGVVAAAPDSAAEVDTLASALSRLRLHSDVRRVGDWMADSDVMSAVERHLALFVELPQKMDRLLTAAAAGSVRVQLVTDDAWVLRR